MQIAQNSVVAIHYTLTNNEGEVIDTSRDQGEPLVYLQGYGNLIPGLESQLEGKTAGTSLTAVVQPADGYGERVDDLIQEVPREAFTGVDELEPGMQFQADTATGPRLFTIVDIEGDAVTVDGNHPLAGEVLNFDVEIVSVRAASEEEIAHGHVHGEGGHHH